MKHIRLPLTEADIAALQAGDEVLLSGPLYTARDAAHQRLCRCLQEGKPLPVELAGETVYYVGPSPAKPGEVIGSAGPTTSYRMDPYTPPLLALGLKGMIGKGRRSGEVVQAVREHGAVYFITIGGAAALLGAAGAGQGGGAASVRAGPWAAVRHGAAAAGCVGRAAAGAAGGILRAVAPEQPDAVQSGAAVRAVRPAAADGAGRYGHRAAGHPAADGVGLLGDGAAAASGGDAPAGGAVMR